MSNPQAAVFEIVERFKKPQPGSAAESIIAPHIVRVNGAEIAIPSGYPIQVHDLGPNDAAMVTMTVFVRRIFVGREYLDEGIAQSVASAQQALVAAERESGEAIVRSSASVEAARRQLEAAQQELWASGDMGASA